METKYIIRGYHWGYNDETYYPCGSYINSIFDNEDKAKKRLIQLERNLWSGIDLGETDSFFNGPEGLAEKANVFIQEKLGKTLFDSTNDCRDVYVPKDLNDEDFLDFLKLVHLQGHKLTKFSAESKFFAIWFHDTEDYLVAYDEETEALVYGDSIQELKLECGEDILYHWDEAVKLTGSLEDLSESPSLLGVLIEKCAELKYSTEKRALSISTSDMEIDDLFSLNELLKNKLFEVKQLAIEEVQEIEKNMVEEY